jgi:hypothetical protein
MDCRAYRRRAAAKTGLAQAMASGHDQQHAQAQHQQRLLPAQA